MASLPADRRLSDIRRVRARDDATSAMSSSSGYKVFEIDALQRSSWTGRTGHLIKRTSRRRAKHLQACIDKATWLHQQSFDRVDSKLLAPAPAATNLQFFKDTPKDYDAWNIDPGTLDVPPTTIEKADSVELVTDSDGSAAIRVTRHWQNSKIHPNDQPRRRHCRHRQRHRLAREARSAQSCVPAGVTSDFATYEIPYGSIERPTTRNNSFEKAQFEVAGDALGRFERSGRRRQNPRPEHSQSGQVRLRRRGQRAAALRCCARPHGPIPTPTRASITSTTRSIRTRVRGRTR